MGQKIKINSFLVFRLSVFVFCVRVPPKKHSFTPEKPVLLKAIFRLVEVMIYVIR